MTSTPDPAAIAASLSEAMKDALLLCQPYAGQFVSNRTVKAMHKRGLYEIGKGITPLGLAVRQYLMEADRG